MADWTDGPEYAPTTRPDAFVAPDASPLSAVAVQTPADEPSATTPAYEAPAQAVPLDQVRDKPETTRDPATAFAVAVTPLTAAPSGTAHPVPTQPLVVSGPTSARQDQAAPVAVPQQVAYYPQASPWGAVHAPQAAPRPQDQWAPAQPLALPQRQVLQPPPPGAQQYPAPQVNPQAFPTPDAPQWYAQYGPSPQPNTPQPVTAKGLLDAVTPGVLIALLTGGIVPALSLPLLVVAAVLARRQRHRRSMTNTAFMVGIAAPLLLSAWDTLTLYGEIAFGPLWDDWQGWNVVACWVLIPVLLLIHGGALRRGEPPERP